MVQVLVSRRGAIEVSDARLTDAMIQEWMACAAAGDTPTLQKANGRICELAQALLEARGYTPTERAAVPIGAVRDEFGHCDHVAECIANPRMTDCGADPCDLVTSAMPAPIITPFGKIDTDALRDRLKPKRVNLSERIAAHTVRLLVDVTVEPVPWYCNPDECVTADCAAHGDPARCERRVR